MKIVGTCCTAMVVTCACLAQSDVKDECLAAMSRALDRERGSLHLVYEQQQVGDHPFAAPPRVASGIDFSTGAAYRVAMGFVTFRDEQGRVGSGAVGRGAQDGGTGGGWNAIAANARRPEGSLWEGPASDIPLSLGKLVLAQRQSITEVKLDGDAWLVSLSVPAGELNLISDGKLAIKKQEVLVRVGLDGVPVARSAKDSSDVEPLRLAINNHRGPGVVGQLTPETAWRLIAVEYSATSKPAEFDIASVRKRAEKWGATSAATIAPAGAVVKHPVFVPLATEATSSTRSDEQASSRSATSPPTAPVVTPGDVIMPTALPVARPAGERHSSSSSADSRWQFAVAGAGIIAIAIGVWVRVRRGR